MFKCFLLFLFSSIFCAEKIYVDEINLYNNIFLSDKELYTALKLKKPTLFIRSEFSYKIYKQDIQNLVGYYKSNGFLDINIIGEYKKNTNQYINLTYIINEGIQYQFDKIIISGNQQFSNKDITNYFQSGNGKHYKPIFIRNQLYNLKKNKWMFR